MVWKFAFPRISFYTFLSIRKQSLFMKYDAEDKIFYSDRNRYISQEMSNIAYRC